MKNNYPKVFLTALLLLCATAATAHDFEVDGIYYNILSEEDKTVEVTYKGTSYSEYSNEYTGSVVIPETVTVSETGTAVIKTFDAWTSTNKNQHSTTSQTSYTLNVEAGNILKFDWSVSSESSYDWLTITLDGTEIVKKSGTTSGSYEKTFTTAGTHTLVVKYSKDGSVNNGDDEGKIYNLVLSAANGGANKVVYSVTTIGNRAFQYCTSLASIEIPNSVTTIGNRAFQDCTSLASIEIPNSVTTIGYSAFDWCISLASIEIPNSVTTIGQSTFYGCSSLASIEIPNSVTTIGENAFCGCSSLASIEIPNSVTTIEQYTFYGCSSLTSIEIPNSVKSIGENAFHSCSSLTSIEIPNSVTTIGRLAFYKCGSLTSIEIPNSVKSIGENAFHSCSSLTSITSLIPADKLFVPGSYAFDGIDKEDCTLYVPAGAKETYAATEGWNEFSNIAELDNSTIKIEINTSEGEFSGTSREYYNLWESDIIEGFSIGTTANNMKSINNCLVGYSGLSQKSIYTITAPEGYMITNIKFDYMNTEEGAHQLNLLLDGKEYISSSTYQSLDVKIAKPSRFQTFTQTGVNEGITFSNFIVTITPDTNEYKMKPDGKCGDNLFWGFNRTTGVLTIFGKGEMHNFPYASSCIFQPWYNDSEGILTVQIDGATTIGDYAFYNCRSLTSITIPNSVTTIGDHAFEYCSSLTSIISLIPADKLFVPGSDAFYRVPTNCTLYVPYGAKETYAATEGWNEFENIVELAEITITVNQYGCGTYCSPYALDFTNVKGLKAYCAIGFNSATQTVTLAKINTIPGGTGIFIKGEPGEYSVPVIENCTEHTLNLLVGTLERTTVNSTDGSMSNFKFTVVEGDNTPKFYPFENNTSYSANRAYLQIPTAWLASAAQKSVSIHFDEGETTDIDEVQEQASEEAVIYDLQGRRVENPTKGIYIVNGKKVFIK